MDPWVHGRAEAPNDYDAVVREGARHEFVGEEVLETRNTRRQRDGLHVPHFLRGRGVHGAGCAAGRHVGKGMRARRAAKLCAR